MRTAWLLLLKIIALSFHNMQYFPDRFVRREINRMILYCPNRSKGCKWEDKLAKLEAHLETCDFTSEQCPQCGTILTPEQVESHKLTCPKAMVECPLAEHGCTYKQTVRPPLSCIN